MTALVYFTKIYLHKEDFLWGAGGVCLIFTKIHNFNPRLIKFCRFDLQNKKPDFSILCVKIGQRRELQEKLANK